MWTKLYEHEIPGVFAGKYGSYGAWLSLEKGGLDFTLAVLRHNLGMIDGFFGYYFMPVTPRWPRAIAMATQLVLLAVAGRDEACRPHARRERLDDRQLDVRDGHRGLGQRVGEHVRAAGLDGHPVQACVLGRDLPGQVYRAGAFAPISG